MSKIIFHIDVNSAYLSWTSVENLRTGKGIDLRNIPSIIGGDTSKRHGIVLAKSIPAKKYEIVTGEPIVNALRKCPGLVIASPDHAMYQRCSEALMAHLASFCPDIEQVSVDECYMDYTPIASRYESELQGALTIKDSVRNTFGFTVNIGISDKKVLAKMASDFRKPDLVHTLYQKEIQKKLWPLPVSRLFLCGHSSAATLNKIGISTIGDLALSDPSILTAHLKSHGQLLWNYANGIDDSEVLTVQAKAKGIGNSITLSEDVLSKEDAKKIILSLSESVAQRLRKSGKRAGLVCLEIKYATFRSVSHQRLLSSPGDSSDLLYRTGCTLFDELWNGQPIRLLGLRTAKLTDSSAPVQMSLFDLPFSSACAGEASPPLSAPEPEASPNLLRDSEKSRKLDRALDQIRARYGKDSVVRGTFYQHKKTMTLNKGSSRQI